MLNFDVERYLRIQSGAVALAAPLDEAVRGVSAGVDNVWFVGSGGAGILMGPAARLLRERSRLRVYEANPAEVVARRPLPLGPTSLVVMPSLSGTTPETLEALSVVKDAGASVFALVGHAGTPLADGAHATFVNEAADDTSCESFYLQSLLLALSLLDTRGDDPTRRVVLADLEHLPEGLVEAKEAFESQATENADRLARHDYHIVTGAGSTWPEAFYYGMCILEEMQWIRTRPVHASDFFHGTLELVEAGVSVIALKGEDSSRPLVERVEKFVPGRSDALWVVDSAAARLDGVSQATRELISPVVLAALLERLSAHLEVIREHPLTTRRYYKRVAY